MYRYFLKGPRQVLPSLGLNIESQGNHAEMYLNICSRCKKQITFLGQKDIGLIRVN